MASILELMEISIKYFNLFHQCNPINFSFESFKEVVLLI
jgi:hypothetical protein